MIVSLVFAGSVALLAEATIKAPGQFDVDRARVSRVHEDIGDGPIVHCTRFERLQCKQAKDGPAEFRCTYREWAERRPWPQKRVELRKEGADWRWIDGDPPRCSVTVLE